MSPTPSKRALQRTCAGCGRKAAKGELVRVVRVPQGWVEPDPTGKKAGRGAYLCPKQACWQEALRKDRLGHVLKWKMTPEDRNGLLEYSKALVEGSTVEKV